MNRKIGGFIVLASTSLSFVGAVIVQQEQILYTFLAVVFGFLALSGLKNHFKELR